MNETEALGSGFCEPNACYPNPCENNGRCMVNKNAAGGYVCTCPNAFTNLSCQDDVDECVSEGKYTIHPINIDTVS